MISIRFDKDNLVFTNKGSCLILYGFKTPYKSNKLEWVRTDKQHKDLQAGVIAKWIQEQVQKT